jgi:hypothetical protein
MRLAKINIHRLNTALQEQHVQTAISCTNITSSLILSQTIAELTTLASSREIQYHTQITQLQ